MYYSWSQGITRAVVDLLLLLFLFFFTIIEFVFVIIFISFSFIHLFPTLLLPQYAVPLSLSVVVKLAACQFKVVNLRNEKTNPRMQMSCIYYAQRLFLHSVCYIFRALSWSWCCLYQPKYRQLLTTIKTIIRGIQ